MIKLISLLLKTKGFKVSSIHRDIIAFGLRVRSHLSEPLHEANAQKENPLAKAILDEGNKLLSRLEYETYRPLLEKILQGVNEADLDN